LKENTGDIIDTGDIILPVNEMIPAENSENHAQNTEIGDTGDIGDIFPTSGRRAGIQTS
jgi:hypothetical protein